MSESRRPLLSWSLVLLVGVLAVIGVAVAVSGAFGECGANASCPSTAKVDGRAYMIASGQGLLATDADLTPYKTVERRSPGLVTLDALAYRLGNVDSTKVLVLKLASGQDDGSGPAGSYLLLVGDVNAWPLTCPYYSNQDPSRPTPC